MIGLRPHGRLLLGLQLGRGDAVARACRSSEVSLKRLAMVPSWAFNLLRERRITFARMSAMARVAWLFRDLSAQALELREHGSRVAIGLRPQAARARRTAACAWLLAPRQAVGSRVRSAVFRSGDRGTPTSASSARMTSSISPVLPDSLLQGRPADSPCRFASVASMRIVGLFPTRLPPSPSTGPAGRSGEARAGDLAATGSQTRSFNRSA